MSTIAIIGHGRSPEGRGWGKRIDSASMVIRMWDWHWQPPADYGTKYDYGLYEIDIGLVRTWRRYNKHTPAKAWLGSTLSRSGKEQLPHPTIRVDQEPWNRIGMRLGGLGETKRLQFTRGTIATCWAIEQAAPGDEVVLVGFDNVASGITASIEAGFSPAYRAQPSTLSFRGYHVGQQRQGNHDFGIELPVMLHLAGPRGVAVKFATDVWP